MTEKKQCNIRIKVLSLEGCEPCGMQVEAAKEIIQEKGMDDEVEVFKIIAYEDDSKVIKEFGKDATVVPITIVERLGEGGKCKRLVGFSKEELEEAIEEVKC